jgi:adenylate cyclase
MGTIYLFQGRFDLAGVHFENAISLSPSDAQIATAYANWLARMGRTQEALKQLDDAARRDPFLPDWYWEIRSVPLLQEKRYEEVIDAVHRISRPQVWNHYTIAIAYAYLGRNQDAMAHAAEVLRLKPDYSACWVKVQEPYRNPADLVHMMEGLRKAGLPE